MKKTALLSVWDKGEIDRVALPLAEAGWQLVASKGTAEAIGELGIKAITVEELTGMPPIMGGRIKTLHPALFSRVLWRTEEEIYGNSDVGPFSLVLVDLYPFASVAAEGKRGEALLEYIDIGGVALLRAAAKNHPRVAVVFDRSDYGWVVDKLIRGELTSSDRESLAAKALRYTASYDATIASALAAPADAQSAALSVASKLLGGTVRKLRYGENPHQQGIMVTFGEGVAGAVQLGGKELSFNNVADASAAWLAVQDLPRPGVVIVKHQTPCGAAVAENSLEAYKKARACDPEAAFGGVIAISHEVNQEVAEAITETFNELVIAPSFTDDALATLRRKKRLRILMAKPSKPHEWVARTVDGGVLLGTPDVGWEGERRRAVGRIQPTKEQMEAMELAWRVAKHCLSNAVVLAKQDAVIGIGSGQVSRVEAVRQALDKARRYGHNLNGAAMASDGFFPFDDSIRLAAEAGISAVLEPGGSIRDDEVIAACDELGIAIVFSGRRHFRHS